MEKPEKREAWLVLIDWIGSEFSNSVIQAIQEDCRRKNRSIMVFTIGSISYMHDESLLEAHIRPLVDSPLFDKVFFCSAQMVRNGGDRKLAQILRRSIKRPTLCFGGEIPGFPVVTSLHRRAYIELMNHLWDVHGYRRFAWVGGPVDNPDAVERKQNFLDFLNSKGISLENDLDIPGDFNLSAGRDAGERLSKLVGRFDVVVAANDSMALGVREILGPQARVVGFDNQAAAAEMGLTTIEAALDDVVHAALSFMENWNDSSPRKSPPAIDLGKLVVRTSCGCDRVAEQKPAPDVYQLSSTERIGPLFEAILDARDLTELAEGLNPVFLSEKIYSWKVLPHRTSNDLTLKAEDFFPDRTAEDRFELMVHSLFRDQELFGYLVHDVSNRNYVLSEWLRINLSITFQSWQRKNESLQVQRFLQTEIDRFTRRQKEVEGVLNSLPVWIVEVDRRYKVRFANRVFRRMLNLPLEDSIEGTFFQFVSTQDRERSENKLNSAFRRQTTDSIDLRFIGKNGSEVPAIGLIQGLKEDGSSNISKLSTSLNGGGIRLVGLELLPLLDGVLQPEELIFKHFDFSLRERELIGHLVQGFDARQIAHLLGVSESTIRVQFHNLYLKTGTANKKDFLDFIAEYGGPNQKPQSLTLNLLSRLFGENTQNRR